MQKTRTRIYRGTDQLVIPTSAGACPFVYTETSTSGNADALAVGDGYDLVMSNDNEIQNLCISQGDVLTIDIDNLLWIQMLIELTWSSTFPTASSAAWGVASARNDAIDSIAAQALFRVSGTAAVFCESDDGTNDVDDKSTGQTMATGVARRFEINFAEGVQSVSPPGVSKGGKGNVVFKMDDGNGVMRQVVKSTLFDMSNYSSNLQPYIQLQKTASTNEVTLTWKEIIVHDLISA